MSDKKISQLPDATTPLTGTELLYIIQNGDKKTSVASLSASLVGPTGPTGATGNIGPTGSDGNSGAVGPTGDTGSVGALGPTGPTGDVGAAGAPGLVGPTGPTGSTGVLGPTGATGSTGVTPSLVFIPTPKICLVENLLGENTVGVQWNCGNKEFLNYSPKYFLFRYRGTGKHNPALAQLRRKGFTHPVHLNGLGKEHSAWYGGAAYTVSGPPVLLFPRITEWVAPINEGELLTLDLIRDDWIYSVSSIPCIKSDIRVRGGKRNKMNAYFYVAIAIELPDGTGCPYTFGPASMVFSLRPQNDVPATAGDGFFKKFEWFIEG